MELSADRTIARPANEVFAVVADPERNPTWQRGMQRCEWTSSPPVRVGSTYRQEARFLGRRVVSEFEVIDLEPGRSITFRTVAGSFPITVRRTVEPVDPDSSRVTAHIRGEPGRFFRIAAPLVRRLAQRAVAADYDRLTRQLEEAGRPRR